jgi:hypothetical protein
MLSTAAQAWFSGAALRGAAAATEIPAKPIAAVATTVNKVFRIEGSLWFLPPRSFTTPRSVPRSNAVLRVLFPTSGDRRRHAKRATPGAPARIAIQSTDSDRPPQAHVKIMTKHCCRLLLVAGALAIASVPIRAQQRPILHTNEAYIEEVTRATTLNVGDPMEVFAFVLESLPDRVKVYPTENYYYFSFFHNGTEYAGNIRIEPHDDGGQTVHFTYYREPSEWHEEAPWTHIVLDAAHDVAVEKIDRLAYRITFQGKSVEFAFNDLSAVQPPAQALASNEKFIGPIFDESGIRFFLVYDAKLRDFHYILDETAGIADEFFPSPRTDHILIGRRTGFAFYRDHHRDRKILIGVYESNMRLNTYFDGPFDQLPDNFIEGETLRKAILEVQPDLKGHIDRFGSAPSGEVRYMIDTYLPYRSIGELYPYHRCASKKVESANYYDCFVFNKLRKFARELPRVRGSKRH